MTKVVVICEDKDLIFTIFKIMALDFKNFDDSQKLTVISLVPSFYRNDFSKKERYQVLLAQISFSDYPTRINSGNQLT